MILEAEVTNASLKMARPYGSLEQLKFEAIGLAEGLLNTGDKIILSVVEGRTVFVSLPSQSFSVNPGSINDSHLADDAVTRQKILDGAVGSVQIAQYAVTKALIATDAIDGTKITENAIETHHVVAGAISAHHIAVNSIDASRIAAYSIVANSIAADAITANKISANAITAAKIATGSITASKIVAGSLTSASGVFGTISADHITTGTLSADRINGGTISGSIINGGTITGTTIHANSITTGTLNAARIYGGTAGSFNGGNITNLNASRITTGSLSADRISGGTISGNLINGGTITGTTINAGSITTGSLNAGRINGGTAGSFNGGNITNLNASSITTGSLSAARITTGSMNAARISGGDINGVSITGNTITGGSITGATVKTASSGERIQMDNGGSFGGFIRFYSNSGEEARLYGIAGGVATDYHFRATFSPSKFIGLHGTTRGSAGTPVYTFSSDTNVGMYSPTTDQLAFSTGGGQRLLLSNSQAYLRGDVYFPNVYQSATSHTNITCYLPNGRMIASTSSAKLKSNVRALQSTDYIDKLDRLKVRVYDCWTAPIGESHKRVQDFDRGILSQRGTNWDRPGLIAEQVARVFPEIVHFDEEGEPTSIDESALLMILLSKVLGMDRVLVDVHKHLRPAMRKAEKTAAFKRSDRDRPGKLAAAESGRQAVAARTERRRLKALADAKNKDGKTPVKKAAKKRAKKGQGNGKAGE